MARYRKTGGSYRKRAGSSPRRTTRRTGSSSRKRSYGGAARTIKIVIEQAQPASILARPALSQIENKAAPKKAKH